MIVHLNGQLMPIAEARISPLDRGFVFGEGIYEGLRAIAWPGHDAAESRVVGLRLHARRMQSGLREAHIDFDAMQLGPLTDALLSANAMRDAFVYWQVTGGTPGPTDPPRSRIAPRAMRPTVFGYCTPQPPLEAITQPPTKKVTICRDIRWELGHVKSISLMGNVLSARKADAAGADEAIFVRAEDGRLNAGVVTEGLATNIVFAFRRAAHDRDDVTIVTPSLDSAPMLAGITRDLLLRLAPEIVQRPVHTSEIAAASEVMLIGTTTMVTSVVAIDGHPVGDGMPGPVARRLLGVLLKGIRAGRDIEP